MSTTTKEDTMPEFTPIPIAPGKVAAMLNMSLGELSDMLHDTAAGELEHAASILRQKWPADPAATLERAENMIASVRAVDEQLAAEIAAMPEEEETEGDQR